MQGIFRLSFSESVRPVFVMKKSFLSICARPIIDRPIEIAPICHGRGGGLDKRKVFIFPTTLAIPSGMDYMSDHV